MGSEIYAVVLLPHMDVVRARVAYHVMKGSDEIHRYKTVRQVGKVPDTVVEGAVAQLAPLGPLRDGEFDGGTAYGVHVTVPYAILGPVPTETLETLAWPRKAADRSSPGALRVAGPCPSTVVFFDLGKTAITQSSTLRFSNSFYQGGRPHAKDPTRPRGQHVFSAFLCGTL
ncbi:hypothetical protein SANT12839_000310 [Streptomyces antimycoticus]|uniref:Uncharacterized protein n=1 Tax=Streptomyces antimycoticus TaxID=68175 RepID=A0A4D4JYK5_9ACTN|nr:hypothetical protein SANT12839_000310 [Streptomyces antimycoticus]